MANKHLTQTRFTDLDLPNELIQGIQDSGFEFCTPIQEKTLPLTLIGKDVSGQAQTGTGKTISYLLALFTRLIRSQSTKEKMLRALVIAPTRELAYQIYQDAETLNKQLNFNIGLAYGGKDYQRQRQIIESGIDVLIGTPGRIIDYYKQKVYSLDAIEVLVLDEADRMFDLGFIRDIRFVLRRLPTPDKRLSMLFSATFTYRVHELAYEHMNNPQTIRVEGENITADKIKESVYYPAMEEKIPLLISLFDNTIEERVLVFVNTKHMGEKVYKKLKAQDYKVSLLSGDIPQGKREKLLDAFKKGRTNVLVATDVAARGLHIPNVSRVFNYDLPQDPEDYVHRVGRTARAGAAGEAISFACEHYAIGLPDIELYIGHKLPSMMINHESLLQNNLQHKNDNLTKPETQKKRDLKKSPNQFKQKTELEKTQPIKSSPPNKNPDQAQQKLPERSNEQKFSKRGYEIPTIG